MVANHLTKANQDPTTVVHLMHGIWSSGDQWKEVSSNIRHTYVHIPTLFLVLIATTLCTVSHDNVVSQIVVVYDACNVALLFCSQVQPLSHPLVPRAYLALCTCRQSLSLRILLEQLFRMSLAPRQASYHFVDVRMLSRAIAVLVQQHLQQNPQLPQPRTRHCQ